MEFLILGTFYSMDTLFDMAGHPASATHISQSDVPIEHLDYEYISKCSNGKELEKILKVLRSGKEGKWPKLEEHCEKRLSNVFPKSKLLRVETKLVKSSWLDEEAQKQYNDDFDEFISTVGQKDKLLRENRTLASSDLPSVRNSGHLNTSNTKTNPPKTPYSERINSYDYRAWDKYDVDGECQKVDNASNGSVKKTKAPNYGSAKINPAVYTDDESKNLAANREKEKGNEAFKAGDYEESICYYDNSIEITPNAAAFNNRGLAKLKLERYYKAIQDFDVVLKEEPSNIKALLRRSSAREKLGDINGALEDLERSVMVDSTNDRAGQLLSEFKERHQKLLSKGGKRVQIVESSDDDDDKVAADDNRKSFDNTSNSPVLIDNAKPLSPDLSQQQPEKEAVVSEEASEAAAEIKPLTILVPPLNENIYNIKQEATKYFSNGQYGDALTRYTECIEKVNSNISSNLYHLSVLHSNRAACRLKIGDLTACIKDCNQSLEYNPKFVKSILRRAIAFESLENIKRAYEDFRLTVVMDSSQLTAHQGVTRTGNILKQKYGGKWRDEISAHAPLPIGPNFVLEAYSSPENASNSNAISTPGKEHKSESSPSSPVEEKRVGSASVPNKQQSSEPKFVSNNKHQDSKTETKAVPTKPVSSIPTRAEQYDKFKNEGNEFVRKGKYREALRCYGKCLSLDSSLVPAHLNSALCHLKLNEFQKAINACNNVIGKEPNNIKALFRRASANKMLESYHAAAKDLKNLLELNPKNGAAIQLLNEVKKLWNEQLRCGMGKSNTEAGKNAPKSKGKKVQIIAESDSDDGEEAVAKPPPPTAPAPKNKTVTPSVNPKNKTKKTEAEVKPKSSKPWLKKTTGVSTAAEPYV